MSATVGVVLFPGSNCEHDVVEAVRPSGETFRQVAAVWAGAPRPDRVEVRDPGFDDTDALLEKGLAR